MTSSTVASPSRARCWRSSSVRRLGNVVRGVPLGRTEFLRPLWTDLRVGHSPASWTGTRSWPDVVALVALALHGANYIALKTEGDIAPTAHASCTLLWPVLVVLTHCQPGRRRSKCGRRLLNNYREHVIGFIIPVLVIAALAGLIVSQPPKRKRSACLPGSCTLSGGHAGGRGLRAVSRDAAVINGSCEQPDHLQTLPRAITRLPSGLTWWSIGMALAVGYFVFVYRMFRGKVTADASGYGH